MPRRLVLLALGAAVAAGVVASRRSWRPVDVRGDGSRAARSEELRRRIERARERLREDVERARPQE